jgi:hydrogenase/urease accessory protein HupE
MTKITLLLISLLPSLAYAHEEHAQSWLNNLWHVFASPEHMFSFSVVVAVGLVAFRFLIRKQS